MIAGFQRQVPRCARSVHAALALFASTLASVVFASAPAAAQGFDAQGFHPAPSQGYGYWSTAPGRVPEHLEWQAGALFGYANDVLVQRDSDGEVLHRPIANLLTLDLLGSIGLLDRLDVGLVLPLRLAATGNDAAPDTSFIDPDGGAGLGDIRFVPRYRFFSTAQGNGAGLHLAGQLGLALPTGDRDAYAGGGFQLEPRFVAEYVLAGGTGFAVNLGYLMRSQSYFADAALEVDDAITWGLGVRGGVTPKFALVADFHGEIGYASVTEGTEPHPIEGLVGGELKVGDVQVRLALGRGLSHGFATPDFRFVVGASYGRATDLDRDDDGLPNRDDRCPDRAEDVDGFEDEDGCPDPDNDGDGVLDRGDRCDNEPEDVDGFEDDDGCPDPDNDGDGILDADDGCPDAAEDVDLFEDTDGCPEEDNDDDGVLDADDRCVGEPEDVDGFEDADGCPDPDNDGDGILDADDACDGEAEVLNGVEDSDGCPDESAIALDLAGMQIVLRQEVTWFDDITSNLNVSAGPVLDAVAVALAGYPEYRVRVVVRTRDRADVPAREAVSLRRVASIHDALVARGVPAESIEGSPYAFPADDQGGAGYEVELRLVR